MTSRLSGFVFDRGKYKGVPPCEVPDAYLLTQWSALKDVPEGHELREVHEAVREELEGRGKLPAAAPKAATNPEAFRVPAPIPAAEAARRARAFANGHADPSVGPPAVSHAPSRSRTALMPCGHPTEDLKPVEGSWKGVCGGCERLQRALAALPTGDAAAVLLDFEAEIRGFKA